MPWTTRSKRHGVPPLSTHWSPEGRPPRPCPGASWPGNVPGLRATLQLSSFLEPPPTRSLVLAKNLASCSEAGGPGSGSAWGHNGQWLRLGARHSFSLQDAFCTAHGPPLGSCACLPRPAVSSHEPRGAQARGGSEGAHTAHVETACKSASRIFFGFQKLVPEVSSALNGRLSSKRIFFLEKKPLLEIAAARVKELRRVGVAFTGGRTWRAPWRLSITPSCRGRPASQRGLWLYDHLSLGASSRAQTLADLSRTCTRSAECAGQTGTLACLQGPAARTHRCSPGSPRVGWPRARTSSAHSLQGKARRPAQGSVPPPPGQDGTGCGIPRWGCKAPGGPCSSRPVGSPGCSPRWQWSQGRSGLRGGLVCPRQACSMVAARTSTLRMLNGS